MAPENTRMIGYRYGLPEEVQKRSSGLGHVFFQPSSRLTNQDGEADFKVFDEKTGHYKEFRLKVKNHLLEE